MTAAVLLLAASMLAGPGESWAPGQVTDVKCLARPQVTYALYLPSNYDAGRGWPVLYVFDPRGRAHLALELFRAAAEEHGWIVASSFDTRSDESAAPSLEVIEAMWADTHARLPLAPRRAYAAGMSGGARLACQLGAAAKGGVAGVIASAGSFADPSQPPPDTPFALFGTTGEEDFNYYEMRVIAAPLARAGVPYRLGIHPGRHGWPPEAVAREAVDWMELRALRTADPAVRDPAFARWRERREGEAREQEAAGDGVRALEAWEALARDLDGVGDPAPARAEAARLQAQPKVAAERARREHLDERDRQWLGRARLAMGALMPPTHAPTASALREDIGIDALVREAAATPPTYDSQSARRRLEDLHGLAAFYLPRGLLARKQPARAAVSYEVALAIYPDRPVDRYNQACAWALAGKKREALTALRRAVADGFHDAAHIETDPDLVSIRDTKEFAEALALARTTAPTAPGTP